MVNRPRGISTSPAVVAVHRRRTPRGRRTGARHRHGRGGADLGQGGLGGLVAVRCHGVGQAIEAGGVGHPQLCRQATCGIARLDALEQFGRPAPGRLMAQRHGALGAADAAPVHGQQPCFFSQRLQPLRRHGIQRGALDGLDVCGERLQGRHGAAGATKRALATPRSRAARWPAVISRTCSATLRARGLSIWPSARHFLTMASGSRSSVAIQIACEGSSHRALRLKQRRAAASAPSPARQGTYGSSGPR